MFKRFITHNWEAKIITLVLSILLWSFVTYRGQSEVILELPVEFKNVPKGYELSSTSTSTVNVTVAGQERLIKALNPQDISVYLDMSKGKPGESIFYLKNSNIKLPSSLTIKKIAPSYLIIHIDELLTKTLSVKPVIKGSPNKGYVISEITITPDEVSVTGTKHTLSRKTTIETEPIEIKGADSTVEKTVPLILNNYTMASQKDTVKVTVVITGETK
ncbi:MAG: CdaR family protein [Nitrospirae bacterium YQR-1]